MDLERRQRDQILPQRRRQLGRGPHHRRHLIHAVDLGLGLQRHQPQPGRRLRHLHLFDRGGLERVRGHDLAVVDGRCGYVNSSKTISNTTTGDGVYEFHSLTF